MNDFKEMTVGEIASQNIEYSKIFKTHKIDFCCGGNISLQQAAKNAGAELDKVVEELNNIKSSETSVGALNFDAWPLDLLIDYVFKFHHHYIRTTGTEIYQLLDKVQKVHGETDPHLKEVQALFGSALVDLNNHLGKEENILFPYILEILKTAENGDHLPEFHCGSIENPIRVMMQEHDDEGVRFKKISELTNVYLPPAHACNSYKLVLNELKQFEENLHIHIHVENNILFPKAIELENSLYNRN